VAVTGSKEEAMRSRAYRRLAAAVLAVGALAPTGAAIAADGAIRPDDRPTHGPGAVVAAQIDVAVRPDDRADRRLPGATVAIVRPAAAAGFDGGDAGIGAMATLGVVTVVAGGAIVGLRRRPRLA
jgi:hypothetical protein